MAEAVAGLVVGRLLVASPALADSNFSRAVVLLLDHSDTGALGVVLNMPSAAPVADILPDWAETVTGPDVLFHGGPVGLDSALAVASLAAPVGSAEEPVGWQRIFGQVGVVDLDTPTELIAPALAQMRIFAGYAGWSAGQLETEIEEGSWYVVPSEPGDVFAAEPLGLWVRVLRRQPGELAWVSTCPLDPTQN